MNLINIILSMKTKLYNLLEINTIIDIVKKFEKICDAKKCNCKEIIKLVDPLNINDSFFGVIVADDVHPIQVLKKQIRFNGSI